MGKGGHGGGHGGHGGHGHGHGHARAGGYHGGHHAGYHGGYYGRSSRTAYRRRRTTSHYHGSVGGSGGGTAGGDEEYYYEGCCYTRKQLCPPLLIMGGIILVLAAIFVALLLTVKMYEGEVCDDIRDVSVGEFPSCTYMSYFDGYFECKSDQVTAYKFTSLFSSGEKAMSNRSFVYQEDILPSQLKYYHIEMGSLTSEIYYEYNLSLPAHVVVVDKSNFNNLRKGDFAYKYVVADMFTTHVSRRVSFGSSYSSNDDYYVVVVNPNPETIKVDESGWLYTSMNTFKDADGKIKSGSRIDGSWTKIILDNSGPERTVPVVLLERYQMTPAMLAIVIIFCLLIGGLLVPEIILSICWCTTPITEASPSTPSKVDQNATPMDTLGPTATPDSSNPPMAYAGAGPESAPPVAYAGSGPEDPSSLPYPGQNVEPAAAAGEPPPPQQVDVYGIPI